VQKTDPFDGAETGGDAELDMSKPVLAVLEWGTGGYARFLKRQFSLPVSTTSQWCETVSHGATKQDAILALLPQRGNRGTMDACFTSQLTRSKITNCLPCTEPYEDGGVGIFRLRRP
jgi:hypothetical protein